MNAEKLGLELEDIAGMVAADSFLLEAVRNVIERSYSDGTREPFERIGYFLDLYLEQSSKRLFEMKVLADRIKTSRADTNDSQV
jgi:hypothetical protein